MARRAPLQMGIGGPRCWLQSALDDLRDFVLHELDLGVVDKLWILLQERQGVARSVEAVHQHEVDLGLELSSHGNDLLGSQIEERISVFHLQKRLRLITSN